MNQPASVGEGAKPEFSQVDYALLKAIANGTQGIPSELATATGIPRAKIKDSRIRLAHKGMVAWPEDGPYGVVLTEKGRALLNRDLPSKGRLIQFKETRGGDAIEGSVKRMLRWVRSRLFPR